MYNKFISAISYKPAIVGVVDKKILKESCQCLHSPSYNHFTKDLAKFSLVNTIYSKPVGAHACEQTAQ